MYIFSESYLGASMGCEIGNETCWRAVVVDVAIYWHRTSRS
jgi:hypothetical protein